LSWARAGCMKRVAAVVSTPISLMKNRRSPMPSKLPRNA